MKYPALYQAASKLSAKSQNYYLWSLRLEYILLIICAAMSINSPNSAAYYYIFSFVFLGALFVFIHRFYENPEQAWYKGRALAESVKTLTWRFVMRAQPFESPDQLDATSTFRNQLRAILAANKFAGNRLPASSADELQVTNEMLEIRNRSCDDRLSLYLKDRIIGQRTWYAKKSGHNQTLSRRWASTCVITYAAAIISSLVRASHPTWNLLPTEPLIALAAAMVGWMQSRRFKELASSYTLTAHEIGMIEADFGRVKCDKTLSDFINEAELAFSREHTQWVARQAA